MSKVLTEGKMRGGNGAIKEPPYNNLHPVAPPPPPTPPEKRLQCSSCSFIAPESEYREKHPYCLHGRLLIGGIALVCVGWIAVLVLTLHGYFG